MAEKSKVILIVFGICSFILIAKIAQLQVFSTKYIEQAKRTTLDKTTKYPARGLIYDRNGKLLVSNNTIYDIDVIYNNVSKNIDTTEICTLLGIDKATFAKNINKNWKNIQFHKSVPFTFLTRVKPEQFSIFQEHLYKFPGFYPIERNIRTYPHKNIAHVLGFLGEVDKEELKKSKENDYSRGDYIGKAGLERTYEYALKGKKGVGYVLKDNLGREVESYDNGRLDSAAISGSDIISSIDLDLQAYGELLMQNKMGSVVAIEPSTGEILTMLSAPSYDPNLLNLDRNRGLAYDSLSQDTLHKPLFDRAVMAKYPPGSIFKTILSLIAMQKGILHPNRTIYCDGTYEVDSRGLFVQKCHHHPTPYNVSIAIQNSCNSYYYQVLREFIDSHGYTTPSIGLDTLISYLNDFGLGNKLGIDYHTEEKGFLPSSDFYNKLYGRVNGWRSTYILSLGIGQGELELTTIQMANLAAILANRGHYYTPHLVKSFVKDEFNLADEYTVPKKVRIDQEYFEPVIEGMSRAITLGTAKLAFVPGIEICGKTGTSENIGKDHSVFFAFAPRDNPKIAIAVYVENAGFGGDIAAPIASLIIEKYLNGSISERRQYLEDRMINLKLINPEQDLLSQVTKSR